MTSPVDIQPRLRYPGAPPFGDSPLDERLFFGREIEAEAALHSILSHDLFVLYAKSGVGKTSLLKARVANQLKERDLWPVFIRMSDTRTTPTQLVRDALRDEHGRNSLEVVGADESDPDLFELMTRIRIWKNDILQLPVLVFDQFEELFTLWDAHAAERSAFIEQLADVVRGVPALGRSDASAAGTLVRPRVKVVLALREEFLGELDVFAPTIPKVLSHRQRLEPLSAEQAAAAIRGPAELPDASLVETSPPFSYDQSAVDAILRTLNGTSDDDRSSGSGSSGGSDGIDPSQLQIVCRHVEAEIVKGRPGIVVTAAHLEQAGGPARILTGYYAAELDKFGSRSTRNKVRDICEAKLISDGRRRSLDAEALDADEDLLRDLVDRRLLRTELRTSRFYYELAHDSLVGPITAHRSERKKRTTARLVGISAAVLIVAFVSVTFLTGRGSRGQAADVTTAPAPVAIDVGARRTGSIGAPGEVDRFEFTADAGSAVTVTMRPSDSFDGVVEVKRAGASAFARANVAAAGGIETTTIIVAESGAHEVPVSGSAASTGDYELSVDSAEPIEAGAETSGSIEAAGAIDQFPFEGSAGQAVTIEARAGDELDVSLTVVDPNGLVIAHSNSAGAGGDEDVTLVLPSDLTYVTQVRGTTDSTGPYTLALLDTDELADGTTVSGSLPADGVVARFPFEGRSGTAATVTLDPSASLNGTIEIVDPAGARIVLADSAGEDEAESITVKVTVEGTYVAAVRGQPGSTGAFEVRLDESSITDITVGEREPARIGDGAPAGAFRLAGRTDDLVTVVVEPTGDLDPVIEVLDPGGVVIERVDAFGATIGETATVRLSEDGDYLVFVTGRNESAGDYELIVLDDRTLLDDGAAPGIIEFSGQIDVFQFRGEADDVVAITMQPAVDSRLDGQLALLDPGGREIEFVDDAFASDAETILAVLPDGGTYVAVARAFAGSTGDYEMRLDRPATTSIEINSSTEGSIEDRGDLAVFRFTTTSPGTRLRIDLASEDRLEFDLLDPDPTFDVVVEDAAGGQEPALLTLRREGEYHVVVRGHGSSNGEFTLTLTELNVDDLPAGEAIEASISFAGEIDIFEFSGTAGAAVKLAAEAGGGLEVRIAILDPSTSEPVGFPSDSADLPSPSSGVDALLEGFLPDDGAYLVYVTGAEGSTGDYTLTRS